MKTLFKIIIAPLLLSACSSLKVELPIARLDSPESNGEAWSGDFSVGAGETRSVEITNDASNRPPNMFSPPVIHESANLNWQLGMGLTERIEIQIRELWDTQIKLQLIGDTAKNAKLGNNALAVTAGLASVAQDQSGSQSGTFGRGGYPWSANTHLQYYDLALIYGRRVTDRQLLYGGPFYTRHRLSGVIHHNRSDDGLSPEANYSFNGEGQLTGFNLGSKWSDIGNVSIYIEAVLYKLQWANAAEVKDAGLSAAMEYNF